MQNINQQMGENGYITLHFSHIHNLENIEKQYKRYLQFFKYNYAKHIPQDRKCFILDMGCGLGETLYALRQMGYKNCCGVDFSNECVEFCKAKGFKSEQGDVLTYFDNIEEKIDVIIFNDIIEHFKKEEMVEILKSMKRALKKDGKIIVKTMNGGNTILGTTTLYSDLTHEIMYDEFSLKTMLNLGGFTRIKVRPSNLYVYLKNPLNYIAWFVNSSISLLLRLYFVLNNKKNKIFTKNIIGIAIKEAK